jgi:hypothetical protein
MGMLEVDTSIWNKMCRGRSGTSTDNKLRRNGKRMHTKTYGIITEVNERARDEMMVDDGGWT